MAHPSLPVFGILNCVFGIWGSVFGIWGDVFGILATLFGIWGTLLGIQVVQEVATFVVRPALPYLAQTLRLDALIKNYLGLHAKIKAGLSEPLQSQLSCPDLGYVHSLD